ncbi:MAG TPA: recombination regulator RecX [Burkholderiaceae bacterium]|nr:recombination regulator RecX [Burkholderiaceae bacterium]
MAPPPSRSLSLKARALQWLAQREHSRLELRRKLLAAARQRDAAERGADETPDPAGEVEAVLDWLVAQRHLSEARFVEARVHARAARFGARRIVQELSQHGVALSPEAAAELKSSELERAREVWARKFGSAPAADAAARLRQMRFLAGRGFAPDIIRRVVRGLPEDD